MNRIQSLLVLLQHAESARDTAQAGLLRARDAARGARAQIEQLLNYRREYELRWSQQFTQRSDIQIVRYYQGFMQRLSQAIEQQERSATHCDEQLQGAQELLRNHELRVASIRKLIERRAAELRAALARREQKDADELAALAAWNREPSTSDPLAAAL